MSAQTRYGFSPAIGAAGGIVDLAPYAIDTFLNEEEDGKMKFGIGVVSGSKPGVNIKVPADGAKAENFEGITTNNRTTEYDLGGKIYIRKGKGMGVMKYGRIYGRVAQGVEPKYGDKVYLVTTGDDAGFFSNKDGVEIKARFMGAVDSSTQVAEIELFNEAQA